MIKIENKTDISGDPFEDNILTLQDTPTKLSFSVNNNSCVEEDRGYVLFSLKQIGEPANIDTYFGMTRKEARKFANRLLRITK